MTDCSPSHLNCLYCSVAVDESEVEVGRVREAEADGDDSAVCAQDAAVLRAQEPHSDVEEERLDEWKRLELGQRHWRPQQLPLRLHRAVGVDELRRLRQKVEVIVPTDVRYTDNNYTPINVRPWHMYNENIVTLFSAHFAQR